MLLEKFIRALQDTQGVAHNSYLAPLRYAIEKVENAAVDESALIEYVHKLEQLVAEQNFALDGNLTNEFAQTLGEAHFFTLCKEKGIGLARIPEQDHATPDFQLTIDSTNIFF